MSKLEIVRKALETNPLVVIVNTETINYLPDRQGYFCHTVDYWVAPKNGLYTADELQAFMVGLVPDLTPTQKDNFRQDTKDSDLSFGKLYFDEKVGEERRITKRILTLNDNELFGADGFIDGKQTIDEEVIEDYTRRVWVCPFPSERFVRDVLDEKLKNSEYRVSPSDLRNYLPKQPSQPNLLQRLIGKK